MILSVVIFLLVGTAAGWVGYRALARIAVWGNAMNQQDANFRVVTEQEIDGALHRVQVMRYDSATGETLHARSASAK